MKAESDANVSGGWTPGQIRNLKIAVTLMSIALVIGFGALVAGLYYKASQIGKSKPAQASAAAQAAIPDPSEIMRLAPGAEIASMAVSDGVLALHVKTGAGDEILLIDMKTGRQTAKIWAAP